MDRVTKRVNRFTDSFALIETSVFSILLGLLIYSDDKDHWTDRGSWFANLFNYTSLSFVVCGILLLGVIWVKKTKMAAWLIAFVTLLFMSGMWVQGYARPSGAVVRPAQALLSLLVGAHLLFMHLGVWTKYIHRSNREVIAEEIQKDLKDFVE